MENMDQMITMQNEQLCDVNDQLISERSKISFLQISRKETS